MYAPSLTPFNSLFNLPGVSKYLNQLDAPYSINSGAQVKRDEEIIRDEPQEAHYAQEHQLNRQED